MENINLNSVERESSIGSYSNNHVSTSQLKKLFVEELKDIFWAEKALTQAMSKMIENAYNRELRMTLNSHLTDTENQVLRLEEIFEEIGKPAESQKCDAMKGLIKEADDIMNESEKGFMRDAGIISAAQKVEHYEIATYGTLRQMAKTLKLDHAVELFQTTLDEEKVADEKLTEIAMKLIYKQSNNNI